jgi:hypothetical protein
MNDDRGATVVSILLVSAAAAFFLAAVTMLLTPAASGYEFSVFEGLPFAFWAFVVIGIIAGQFVVVWAALLGRPVSDLTWRIGIAVIVAFEAVLFALPYYRGYAAYGRGDLLTHVGFVRDIQATGMLAQVDIYPNVHLLVSTLSYATGVDPLFIINSIAVVIPLFSVLAFYALVVRVYDRDRALLTLPFATLFVGASAYVNPSPFAQSSLLVPFVLYLFVRERQTRSIPVRVTLLLATVSIVIYHPLTTVFLIFGVAMYAVVESTLSLDVFSSWSMKWRQSVGKGTTVPLLTAVFLTWYYSFEPILNKSEKVLRRLLTSSSGQSDLSRYSSTVEETSPKLVDLVTVGLADYGVSALLMTIGGLYFLVAGYRAISEDERSDAYELWFLLAVGTFVALTALFLLFDLIVGFGRPLLYVRVFGVLLAGPLFYSAYRTFDANRVVTGVLCLFVVSHAALGLATLYHSPLKAEAGHQVTDAELDATHWFFVHRDPDTETVEHGITLYRFGDAFFGRNGSLDRVERESQFPPPHYGYNSNRTYGASYEDDRYLLVTPRGRRFYTAMYPDYRDQWQFYQSDFRRLDRDDTVAQLYDNGEVTVYRVDGTAE